jgi:hypothetical protein
VDHALLAEHRSDATVRCYTESGRMLVAFLGGADALDASTDDLRRSVAHLLKHPSPATAAVRHRSLQQFYGWAVRDGLVDTNPMSTMRPPTVPDKAVPIVPGVDEDLDSVAVHCGLGSTGAVVQVTLRTAPTVMISSFSRETAKRPEMLVYTALR